MTKISPLSTVTHQLEKLNKIMQQQQQFNRKYISQVLHSRQSKQSTISDNDILNLYQNELNEQNRQIYDCNQENQDNNYEQNQQINNQDDYLHGQVQVNFRDIKYRNRNIRDNGNENNLQKIFIQNNMYYLQEEQRSMYENYQNQNDKTKDINKIFGHELQKQLAEYNINQDFRNNQLDNFIDLDQQTTTKSLAVQEFFQIQRQIQIEKDKQRKIVSPSSKNRKTSNKNRNKKQCQERLREYQMKQDAMLNQDDSPTMIIEHRRGHLRTLNNQSDNYYSSAAATQTLEMSLQKQTVKQTSMINMSKKKKQKQNGQSKGKTINKGVQSVKDDGNKPDKNRRPFTAIKVSSSAFKISHNLKVDKNQLRKLKEKGLASTDKKMTNRKTKTKRQNPPFISQTQNTANLNKNQSTSNLPQNNSNLKTLKKNQSNCQYNQHNTNQSGVSNNLNVKTSSGKGWMKSIDKSTKKLNRVNITKLQQNFKRTKDTLKSTNTQKSDPKQGNKYMEIMYANQKKNMNSNPYEQDKILAYSGVKNQGFKRNNQCHSSNPSSLDVHYIHKDKRNDLSTNINNFESKGMNVPGIVQKLDFDKKIPIMQRIIESKNIFKSYNIMTNNYTEAARKMNTKYVKSLEKQIKQLSQQAIFKMKIFSAIVVFFSQFFVPSKKNIMGMIAKYNEKQQNNLQRNDLNIQQFNQQDADNQQQKTFKLKNNPHHSTSQDTLIVSLLDKPKDLIDVMQTLPIHLYSCNLLSEQLVNNLLDSYQKINEQLDEELDLQLFMLKKTKLFNYFHQLVEFIRFLQHYELIEKTQRRNLNRNKNSMIGYYSSRSRREIKVKNNRIGNQNNIKKKVCDSERKLTLYDGDTDRFTNDQGNGKNVEKIKSNKEWKCQKQYKQVKENKQIKTGIQKQSKIKNSREREKNK